MNNQLTLKQAAKTYERLWSARFRELCVGEEADAGFDAGEFSGAFHHNYQEKEHDRILDVVVNRTGYARHEILMEVDDLYNRFMDRTAYQYD